MIDMVLNKIQFIPRNIRKRFYLRWNKFLFKLNKISYGTNCMVYNRIYIKKEQLATINIGNHFQFNSGDCYNPLARNIRGSIFAFKASKIEIGDNVGLSSCVLRCSEFIKIGNHVNIGADTIILDTDSHSINYRIRRDRFLDAKSAKTAPVVIEDDVLIGTRCIILKGVTIGARSVIGAGSVVTKSIPADCVAAGNPCRVIKKINQDERV